MSDFEDVFKHLFYSSWLLLVFEMFRIMISFINVHPSIILIVDLGFNFVLILFGIGIIRLGSSRDNLSFWKEMSISLIVAGVVEIVLNILYYAFIDIIDYSPLIFVRLVLIIINLLAISFGFYQSTRLTDNIIELYSIPDKKSKLYLPLGFFALFFPYITSWIAVYLYPEPLNNILSFSATFVFLIASFFIVLGILDLTFIFKIVLEKIKDKTVENPSSEKSTEE